MRIWQNDCHQCVSDDVSFLMVKFRFHAFFDALTRFDNALTRFETALTRFENVWSRVFWTLQIPHAVCHVGESRVTRYSHVTHVTTLVTIIGVFYAFL